MTPIGEEGSTDPVAAQDPWEPREPRVTDSGLSATTDGHDPLIPGYRSFSPIGQGGFSIVYSAYQDRFDRTVAVKVISSDLRDAAAARRFTRECRVVGKLTGHPNIITVFEAGSTADRRPFIAMQHLPGGSVADTLRRTGPLGVADTLRIAAAIADALHAAHEKKILHRDVKPGNILMSDRGEPVLSDFGIASRGFGADMSASGYAFTPSFAAPEVLRGDDPSVASDLYGLGATMYAMLAGTPPFGLLPGDNLATMMLRVLSEELAPIRRPDVHADVDGLVRGLLARDPAARPRDAAAVAQDLRRLHALDGVTRRPSPLPPTGPPPAAPARDPGPGPVPVPVPLPVEGALVPPADSPPVPGLEDLRGPGTPSVAGHRPLVPPADEVSGRREAARGGGKDRAAPTWLRRIRAGVLVPVGLALAVLTAVGLWAADEDAPPGSGSGTSTISTPPTPATPVGPSGLSVTDRTTVVRLTWTNGSVTRNLLLRVFGPAGAGGHLLPDGATRHDLEVDPQEPYCFTVGVVLGAGATAVEGAWSDFVCIRGATPPPSTPSS
ncbi:serine/threonine protein kinase [Frankia sp. EI5c]|uniref:serine/threonine-protein kinase n=1 Tax=Frankia sp. EI5c TaxID=683316 RepID=UPI0007C3DC8C|nr:serine/threonine-protein kinase [Frankia sp. EI5c]OAA29501.1 serine/threonine protein kinase [Frankia sp. EI5c]